MVIEKLNLIGYVCPIPLLQTKKMFAQLAIGDILVIETEHPRAVRNILDWSYREGYPVEVDDSEQGLWVISVKKTR